MAAALAGAELGQDARRLEVGLLYQLDHPGRLRCTFELYGDGAPEAGVENRLEILPNRRHAAAGRHVAVHLAVAVRHVHVPDHSGEHGHVVERRARELEMRDVRVRLDRRMVNGADQTGEGVDVARDAVLERFELDCDLDALRRPVLGELPHVLDDQSENLVGREHLQVAVILAGDEHDIAAAEVRLLVDVRLAALEREPTHGGHEVHEPERDADRGPHG